MKVALHQIVLLCANESGITEQVDLVEISAVCVDPAARREGLGGALTRFVAEQIRASGGRPMLHVREGNEAAIALYEGLGFVRRAERFVYALAPPGWERPETSAGDPS